MRKFLTAVTLGALTACLCMACPKKEEEVPPMPSATAAPTPTPPAELAPEEDAGSDAADGDADASDAKKTGTSTTKLVSCCRQLASNAKSAPMPQQGFMLQAAATCESFARGGNSAAVNGVLRQYNIPCN